MQPEALLWDQRTALARATAVEALAGEERDVSPELASLLSSSPLLGDVLATTHRFTHRLARDDATATAVAAHYRRLLRLSQIRSHIAFARAVSAFLMGVSSQTVFTLNAVPNTTVVKPRRARIVVHAHDTSALQSKLRAVKGETPLTLLASCALMDAVIDLAPDATAGGVLAPRLAPQRASGAGIHVLYDTQQRQVSLLPAPAADDSDIEDVAVDEALSAAAANPVPLLVSSSPLALASSAPLLLSLMPSLRADLVALQTLLSVASAHLLHLQRAAAPVAALMAAPGRSPGRGSPSDRLLASRPAYTALLLPGAPLSSEPALSRPVALPLPASELRQLVDTNLAAHDASFSHSAPAPHPGLVVPSLVAVDALLLSQLSHLARVQNTCTFKTPAQRLPPGAPAPASLLHKFYSLTSPHAPMPPPDDTSAAFIHRHSPYLAYFDPLGRPPAPAPAVDLDLDEDMPPALMRDDEEEEPMPSTTTTVAAPSPAVLLRLLPAHASLLRTLALAMLPAVATPLLARSTLAARSLLPRDAALLLRQTPTSFLTVADTSLAMETLLLSRAHALVERFIPMLARAYTPAVPVALPVLRPSALLAPSLFKQGFQGIVASLPLAHLSRQAALPSSLDADAFLSSLSPASSLADALQAHGAVLFLPSDSQAGVQLTPAEAASATVSIAPSRVPRDLASALALHYSPPHDPSTAAAAAILASYPLRPVPLQCSCCRGVLTTHAITAFEHFRTDRRRWANACALPDALGSVEVRVNELLSRKLLGSRICPHCLCKSL
jgi:hypothetical protein